MRDDYISDVQGIELDSLKLDRSRQREGYPPGAYVPIMFFLILLVMFLGALGYGYVQTVRVQELEGQLKAGPGAITPASMSGKEVQLTFVVGKDGILRLKR